MARNNKKHQTYAQGDNHITVGSILAGKFKLTEKIGAGSFGQIYKTINLDTGEICATKFEKRDDTGVQLSLLVREIKVLMEIQGSQGFPNIHFYGRDEFHNYFMIDYLGYNLESLLRKCGGKLSLNSTLHLGMQMLNRIETFHYKNFIHRDIKPENFVMGNNDFETLYMIDFGLSKYFKDENGKHIPQMEKKGLIGTARYASINAHLGREQSRRDDIESIGYVLIYLRTGQLPWMNLLFDNKQDKYKKIQEVKMATNIEFLCEGTPKCFFKMFQHIKSLSFIDQPDYSYLKSIFNEDILANNAQFNGYDWEKLPEFKKKRKNKEDASNFSIRSPLSAKKKKLTLQLPEQKQSFLNVPMECQSPEKNSKVVYFDYQLIFVQNSKNISMNTSRCNNYQLSNLMAVENTGFKIQPIKMNEVEVKNLKRKESKSFTALNKQKSFFRQATVKRQEDNFYEYDNLHEIAEDKLDLNFQNICVKMHPNEHLKHS